MESLENNDENIDWQERLEQAAESLFENMFEDAFIQARENSQIHNGQPYITKIQFQHSVMMMNDENDTTFTEQSNHFMGLCSIATDIETGYIFKANLLKVILNDMKEQMSDDNEVNPEDNKTPLKEAAQASYESSGQKLRKNNRNNLSSGNYSTSISKQYMKASAKRIRVNLLEGSPEALKEDDDNKENLKKHKTDLYFQSRDKDQELQQARDILINERINRLKKQNTMTFGSLNLNRQTSYKSLKQDTIKNLFDSRNNSQVLIGQNMQNTAEDEKLNEEQIMQKVEFIFDQIFQPYFQYNIDQNKSLIRNDFNNQIITWPQFEDAINNYSTDQEKTSVNLLQQMFDKADIDSKGFISKDQLFEVIKDDILNGHVEYSKQKSQSKGRNGINYNTIESETYGTAFGSKKLTQRINKNDSMNQLEANETTAPQNDPILRSLQQIQNQENDTKEICYNLNQTIEYINQYKINEYKGNANKLKFLFEALQQITGNIAQKVEIQINENQDQKLQNMQNQEMEAQIEQLLCDVEKLQTYETNYHQVEYKLEMAVKRNEEIEVDYQNLQHMNNDMIMEIQKLKLEQDKGQIQQKTDKAKLQHNKRVINSLKKKIIKQYERNSEVGLENELENYQIIKSILTSESNSGDDQDDDTDLEIQERKSSESAESRLPKNSIQKSKIVGTKIKSIPQDHQIYDQILDVEQKILQDLETTELLRMKDRFSEYITEYVRLEREGLNNAILNLKEKNQKYKQKLLDTILEKDEFKSGLNTSMQISKEWESKYQEAQQEIESLKSQLLDAAQENQKVLDEKKRIVGVNALLEQQIQIEKSEKMMYMSEVSHIDQHLAKNSSNSKLSAKFSRRMTAKVSSFHKTLTFQNTGTGKKQNKNDTMMSFQRNSVTSMQNMWLKNQIRNRNDELSEYKSQASNNSRMNVHVIDDLSEDSPAKLNPNGLKQDFDKNVSKLQLHKKPSGINFQNLLASQNMSFRSNNRSGIGNVQVISDFDSEMNESIMVDAGDLEKINDNIMEIEAENLEKKRNENVYDHMGLEKGNLDSIFSIVRNEERARDIKNPHTSFSQSQEKTIFSDQALIYTNKMIKKILIIIYRGILYLIQHDEDNTNHKLLLNFKPVHILDDISKVVNSDVHKDYFALKLRDLKKNGYRDHLILDYPKRELLFDFMVDYSYQNDDDIIFEQNEEFSILVNSHPIWFNFEDINKCKNEQDKLFKANDKDGHSGLVQIKKKNALNFLKGILNQSCWEFKYVVLKGFKLYIYQGAALKKPDEVFTITKDLQFQNIRRAEADGMNNSIRLVLNKDMNPILISAPSEDSQTKWNKAFKKIQDKLLKKTDKIVETCISNNMGEDEIDDNEKQNPNVENEDQPSRVSGMSFFSNFKKMEGYLSAKKNDSGNKQGSSNKKDQQEFNDNKQTAAVFETVDAEYSQKVQNTENIFDNKRASKIDIKAMEIVNKYNDKQYIQVNNQYGHISGQRQKVTKKMIDDASSSYSRVSQQSSTINKRVKPLAPSKVSADKSSKKIGVNSQNKVTNTGLTPNLSMKIFDNTNSKIPIQQNVKIMKQSNNKFPPQNAPKKSTQVYRKVQNNTRTILDNQKMNFNDTISGQGYVASNIKQMPFTQKINFYEKAEENKRESEDNSENSYSQV